MEIGLIRPRIDPSGGGADLRPTIDGTTKEKEA